MIDYELLERKMARRNILDWLWDLQSRAIDEGKFSLAAEAYLTASRIYAGRDRG